MGFPAFGARFSAPGWFGWMLLNWLNSQQNDVVFLFCFLYVYAAKLCCVLSFLAWNGISFFARFFLSTRNLLPLLQLVLDRAGTLTRRIFPFNLLKLTRNGAAFLAKDSRKWLSYVCRTRFHTFSLSHLLSPLSRCSLTAHCFFS